MKKRIVLPLFTVTVLLFSGKYGCISAEGAEKPSVSAKSAVLISADTGEIVYSVNCSEKLPMASTTKIMTALLCLESGDLYSEFTVDSDAIMVEGSSMGLQKGDIVTKYALCCGMLLPSGNDSANATAVKLAGSIEKFADMMNQKAQELGLSKTYFVTPSGLEGEGHGSSAYDMAILAREALKNDIFREICSSESMKVRFGNPPYDRWLKNTNKLLSMYDGVYGVKTGFTDEAGRCLVSACERDGKNLICVTLNDGNDWNDHIAMYDYGFDTVKSTEISPPENLSLNIVGADTEKVPLKAESFTATLFHSSPSDFEYTLISPPFVYAPVSKGEQLAELKVSFNGREVKRLPVFAGQDVGASSKKEESKKIKFLERLRNFFS